MKITVPGSLKTISRGVFYNCSSLHEVELEEGVTTIENTDFLKSGEFDLFQLLIEGFRFSLSVVCHAQPFRRISEACGIWLSLVRNGYGGTAVHLPAVWLLFVSVRVWRL
ncbi:MAG: leucine-rich repeat protein [Eubacterium sp.]|nr:leucine-rich repeat protein [Eubacterium sp.]